MADYAVTSGAKDWDDNSSTNTTLNININNVAVTNQIGYMDIDTSAIGSDEISAASFNWYDESYSIVGRGITPQGRIFIYNSGTSLWVQIYSFATTPAAGWKSHALTSGELDYIQSGGDSRMRFRVDDPGASAARTWLVRAYEFVTSPDYAGYLSITHAPAAGGTPKVSIVMPIVG